MTLEGGSVPHGTKGWWAAAHPSQFHSTEVVVGSSLISVAVVQSATIVDYTPSGNECIAA